MKQSRFTRREMDRTKVIIKKCSMRIFVENRKEAECTKMQCVTDIETHRRNNLFYENEQNLKIGDKNHPPMLPVSEAYDGLGLCNVL